MGRSGGDSVVYLDYNATAPIRPEVRAAIVEALGMVGNASSAHRPGTDAAKAVERARAEVAALIACSPNEIIFTSGATEANNLAVRSGAIPGRPIVVSAVEHPAVREAVATIAAEAGSCVSAVGVCREGLLRAEQLEMALAAHPSFVSIMAANNETGVINDVGMIANLSHKVGALMHTDATQLVGRLPIDTRQTSVDLLSISAHKFGGPQGVGALFVRRGVGITIRPLAYGGGHERGYRPGTLNVAGIVGFGVAAAVARQRMHSEAIHTRNLRDRFESEVLRAVPEVRRAGSSDHRLPGVSSLTFVGAPADAMLAAMPGVAASEGSACTAGAPGPSQVLLAMGFTRDEAECTVRFSLGYATTPADVDRAIECVIDAAARVRAALRLPAGSLR